MSFHHYLGIDNGLKSGAKPHLVGLVISAWEMDGCTKTT